VNYGTSLIFKAGEFAVGWTVTCRSPKLFSESFWERRFRKETLPLETGLERQLNFLRLGFMAAGVGLRLDSVWRPDIAISNREIRVGQDDAVPSARQPGR
jgi:hypothetical protein